MASATPARMTRSRAAAAGTPLPVAVTQRSNAYGSRDSASAEGQVSERGDLEHALTSRRGASARRPRGSTAGSSVQSPVKTAPKRKGRAPQPAITEEEDDDDDDDDDEEEEEEEEEQDEAERPQTASSKPIPFSQLGTALEGSALYDRIAERRRRREEAAQNNDIRNVARPWDFTVFSISVMRFFENILNHIKYALTAAPLLLVLLLLASAVATFFTIPHLPTHLEAHRERMTRGARLIVGLPEWEQPPAGLEKEWIFFKHHRQFHPDELPDYNVPDLQWTININLVGRLEKLEEKTDKLTAALEDVKSSVSSILPRLVVVDVVDKRIHLTNDFYDALHEKLRGDDAVWSAFLEKNQQAINEMENSRLDRFFDTATKSKDIISARTALEMIQDENERLLDMFAKNTEKERAAFVKDVRGIAEESVVEVLGRHSGGSLLTGDLAKHFYIENTLLAMQNLDFFSPKHGSKTIPKLTSPSAVKPQPNLLAQIWAWAMYPPNRPVEALKPWSEYRDAWCATESTNKGMAQLGIKVKHTVAPAEFVVEHIPASGSLSIASAPRDVELWMDAGSVKNAEAIQALIETESVRYKGLGGCTNAPGEGFVCVARGRYDIHDENWVQRFPTFLNVETWPDFDSKVFVVRAATNWGADQTCLYRLRLHGMTREEEQ